jgi:hypothetical protein
MGLIGGGLTAVGTAVGRQFTSAAMSVMFLTLAFTTLTRRGLRASAAKSSTATSPATTTTPVATG